MASTLGRLGPVSFKILVQVAEPCFSMAASINISPRVEEIGGGAGIKRASRASVPDRTIVLGVYFGSMELRDSVRRSLRRWLCRVFFFEIILGRRVGSGCVS